MRWKFIGKTEFYNIEILKTRGKGKKKEFLVHYVNEYKYYHRNEMIYLAYNCATVNISFFSPY